jgi:hypothetical protein
MELVEVRDGEARSTPAGGNLTRIAVPGAGIA